jgi:hypothetical protein
MLTRLKRQFSANKVIQRSIIVIQRIGALLTRIKEDQRSRGTGERASRALTEARGR